MNYELKMWQDIKDEMDYPEHDNNKGYIYGVYWLDDNDEVLDVEWLTTEQERTDYIIKELTKEKPTIGMDMLCETASELTEYIFYMLEPRGTLEVVEKNGDIRYTDKAQDIFCRVLDIIDTNE